MESNRWRKFSGSKLGTTSLVVLPILAAVAIFMATSSLPDSPGSKPMSAQFQAYWYNNEAEITSYRLEQARYGELRNGEAALIFVTEHFDKDDQVKTDKPGRKDYSVLKLNLEKKFVTGIYPYSMLTSSFLPVDDTDAHAAKITTTVQEWCGQVFAQLNNRGGGYKIETRSYFGSEGDQDFTLKKAWLEDELWSKIRLNPELLPTGEQEIIPAFFYTRLMHKEVKAYKASASKDVNGATTIYTIRYPEPDRTLAIRFGTDFPHLIEGWEETYVDGFGDKAEKLTTKATKIKTIKLDYWKHNANADEHFRQELGLGSGN